MKLPSVKWEKTSLVDVVVSKGRGKRKTVVTEKDLSVFQSAAKDGKPVMLYFHASKSASMAKSCSTLDLLTFRQKGVTGLSRQFHSVRLDAEKVDKALLKRFKVKTAPTLVFVDKNGKALKKVSGKSATSVKALVAVMKAVLKKNAKTKSSSFASTVGKTTSKKGKA